MIRSGKLEARFKASDIYRNASTTLKDSEVTLAALKYLEEKRIIAQEKQIGGVGRHATDLEAEFDAILIQQLWPAPLGKSPGDAFKNQKADNFFLELVKNI